jgi:hypothetical protein
VSRYRRALHFSFARQANAYGFTLTVWGTGAIAIWELGEPGPGDVFAFVGGALTGVVLVAVAVIGVREPVRADPPTRRGHSTLHLGSVPAALASGWGVSAALSGTAGFFLATLAAVAVFEVVIGLEIELGLVEPRRRDAPGREKAEAS